MGSTVTLSMKEQQRVQVVQQYDSGRITVQQASALLDRSERQVHRLVRQQGLCRSSCAFMRDGLPQLFGKQCRIARADELLAGVQVRRLGLEFKALAGARRPVA